MPKLTASDKPTSVTLRSDNSEHNSASSNKTLSTTNSLTKSAEQESSGNISKNNIDVSIGHPKTLETVNIIPKFDYNRIAVLLEKNNSELLEKYKTQLKIHNKEVIQFIPDKNTNSLEQAFMRLKKQGIKLVTVCSEKLINSSPNKRIKYNKRWHKILHKNEMIYIPPDNVLDNDIATSGVMTKKIPNEQELHDIALGIYTLNSLSKNKNGQSVVVQLGKVLGIESESETTSDLIDRCIDLKNTSKGGILIKTTKPYQKHIFLYPTIDIQTVSDAYTAKLSGIIVNANYCRIENMSKVIKFANRKNIFIMGI